MEGELQRWRGRDAVFESDSCRDQLYDRGQVLSSTEFPLSFFFLLLFCFFKKKGLVFFSSDCTIFGAKNLSPVVSTASAHQNGRSHAKHATPAIQGTAEKPPHKNGNPSSLCALQLGLFSFHMSYPCHHSSLKDHASFQLSTTKKLRQAFKTK